MSSPWYDFTFPSIPFTVKSGTPPGGRGLGYGAMSKVDWALVNEAPRYRAGDLLAEGIPAKPGVYAWYRRGRPVYVGKADVLRNRIWRNHLGQSLSVGGSAFRRNVAEYLGFASSADIKAGRVALTPDQLAAVRAWIVGCRLTWVVCSSTTAAVRTESALKAEWMPPLTKI
jgi:hypothetical protein